MNLDHHFKIKFAAFTNKLTANKSNAKTFKNSTKNEVYKKNKKCKNFKPNYFDNSGFMNAALN